MKKRKIFIKSLKIFVISLFSIFVLPICILFGSLFYDIVILEKNPKVTYLNTNIEDYQTEVSELGNASSMLPSLDSITDYEEIKYSYKESLYSTFLGFYSEGISLYVSYSDNYLEEKNDVLSNYNFLENPIIDNNEYYIMPLTKFVYRDFTYQVVMDYNFYSNNEPTCSSFMLIGYSDTKQEIAYHYYYDSDLDFICLNTEDSYEKMTELIEEAFYYFED